MTDQDYSNGLDFLIEKLNSIRAYEIANEIKNQINHGKTITLADSSDLREMNISRREVGKTKNAPLSKKEAFEFAVEYIEKIVLDIPGYVQTISSKFGEEIIWEFDSSLEVITEDKYEGFNLKQLIFNNEEIQSAKNELNNIKKILKNDGIS